jgi:hypothetical protein
MSFLNPIYLWALLGLAIPIAIHFWSKKEGKTIKVGSIQLLDEAESKQSSSINLNELLLLLLRLLLVTLLVFILAEPQINRDLEKSSITYIIEPSLLDDKAVVVLLDSIDSEASIKLLDHGFPEYDTDQRYQSKYNPPNYWQLAKDMESLHTDSIVVLTKARSVGFKGMRPLINTHIEWIIIDPSKGKKALLNAVKKEDNLQLLSLESNSKALSFDKTSIQLSNDNIVLNDTKDSVKVLAFEDDYWTPIKLVETINVLLFHDNSFLEELSYIEAALNAISKYIDRPIEIDKVNDTTSLNINTYDAIIWLSSFDAPETDNKMLLFKSDDLANELIISSTSENRFYLTDQLNSENIVDRYLPEQLLKFLDLHHELENTIDQFDQSVMSEVELRPVVQKIKVEASIPRILIISKWLWIIFGIVLIIERLISNLRHQ